MGHCARLLLRFYGIDDSTRVGSFEKYPPRTGTSIETTYVRAREKRSTRVFELVSYIPVYIFHARFNDTIVTS